MHCLQYLSPRPNPAEVIGSISSSFQRPLLQVGLPLPPSPITDSYALPTSIAAPRSVWKPQAELIFLGQFLLAYRTKKHPPLSSLWASGSLSLLCAVLSVSRHIQISSLHFKKRFAWWKMGKEAQNASLPKGNLQPCHCKRASGFMHGTVCLRTAWQPLEPPSCELRYTSEPANMENGVQITCLPLSFLPILFASHSSSGTKSQLVELEFPEGD